MTIDRFRADERNAFVGYAPEASARFYETARWLARLLRVEVTGVDNVPRGRAIVVANHTFGCDIVFPLAEVWRAQDHRAVFALGEHAWWLVPFLRKLAARIGTVDGTPENADRLLEHEELVLVLPGGLRESVKPRELRYRLLWGHRYGFVRAAIRNHAPIIPLAAIGGDDIFDFVGNAYRRGERLLRRAGIPIPMTKRLIPIPHLVQLCYRFGEPIYPPDDPALANDAVAVKRMRHEVEGALHELIEGELARRCGIDLS